MACNYQQLLHDVAIRMNGLVGSQTAALNTTYDTATLTSANWKSADWPFNGVRDAILMAEQDFATAIALTGNHPWRSFLAAVTSNVGNATNLPFQSSGNKDIVGVWGGIYDATDGEPLSEMPLDVVLRRTRNANSHYVTPVYYYKIDGRRIYHTRTNVILECCIYDRSDQATSFTNNNDMLLPDVLEPAIVARAISLMTRDGAYADQAAVYRQYSDDALVSIRGGASNIAAKSIPVPITQGKAG